MALTWLYTETWQPALHRIYSFEKGSYFVPQDMSTAQQMNRYKVFWHVDGSFRFVIQPDQGENEKGHLVFDSQKTMSLLKSVGHKLFNHHAFAAIPVEYLNQIVKSRIFHLQNIATSESRNKLISYLQQLNNRKKLCCPFHEERNPSASIILTKEGNIFFRCFSSHCCKRIHRQDSKDWDIVFDRIKSF